MTITYADMLAEQREYQALVARARAAGVPVDLAHPDSTDTVAGLEAAVIAAESKGA